MNLNKPSDLVDISFIDDISSDDSKTIIQQTTENIEHSKSNEPCSSDDTIFLNLPQKCSKPPFEQQSKYLCNEISPSNSFHSKTTDNDSETNDCMSSITPMQSISDITSTSSKINIRANCIDKSKYSFIEWSSSDEDTSFYNDKSTALSSKFDIEQPQLQSKYFNSNRGAYITLILSVSIP